MCCQCHQLFVLPSAGLHVKLTDAMFTTLEPASKQQITVWIRINEPAGDSLKMSLPLRVRHVLTLSLYSGFGL